MTYVVKEIYRTLQGEGANSGCSAVLLRFAGCNLWSGRDDDRHNAICQFCDTDFVGTDGSEGGKFSTATELAEKVARIWGPSREERFVVCTGGEPLLQLDEHLVSLLQRHGFRVAIETNGTLLPPAGIDWICVSPKAGAPLRLQTGDELKLVVPQEGVNPAAFAELDFEHFFLQPMDGENLVTHQREAAQYCIENPRWRLSLQTHKVVGLP